MAYDRGGNPDFMRSGLPRLALKYDYLLDAVFALTALHLAYEKYADPQTSEYYLSAAVSFRDRGLQRMAPAMREFQLENTAEEGEMFAMFWFSAITGMLTMSMVVVLNRQRLSIAHSERPSTAKPFISMLVETAQLWRGTQAIIDVAKTLRARVYISVNEQLPDSEGAKLDPEIDARLSQLETFIEKPGPSTGAVEEEIEDQHANIYRSSVSLMRKAFESILATGTFDDTMAWAPTMGNDFALLLEEGVPRALLSTMVYGTLLARVSHKWWAEGVGKALVDECSMALAESPEEWHDLIRWARAEVDLPVTIVQHDTPGVSHAG